MQLFADKGFDAKSIRDLAKVADANVVISIVFGKKVELAKLIGYK